MSVSLSLVQQAGACAPAVSVPVVATATGRVRVGEELAAALAMSEAEDRIAAAGAEAHVLDAEKLTVYRVALDPGANEKWATPAHEEWTASKPWRAPQIGARQSSSRPRSVCLLPFGAIARGGNHILLSEVRRSAPRGRGPLLASNLAHFSIAPGRSNSSAWRTRWFRR